MHHWAQSIRLQPLSHPTQAMSLRTRCLLSVSLFLALTSATGCLRRSTMWIDGGSTAARVIFGLATRRGSTDEVHGVDDLRVLTCYEAGAKPDTLWHLRRANDADRLPVRIVYGEVPRGFSVLVAARPLLSACYEASVRGPGIASMVRFRIVTDSTSARIEEIRGKD